MAVYSLLNTLRIDPSRRLLLSPTYCTTFSAYILIFFFFNMLLSFSFYQPSVNLFISFHLLFAYLFFFFFYKFIFILFLVFSYFWLFYIFFWDLSLTLVFIFYFFVIFFLLYAHGNPVFVNFFYLYALPRGDHSFNIFLFKGVSPGAAILSFIKPFFLFFFVFYLVCSCLILIYFFY